jgi:WD40 repeat protein
MQNPSESVLFSEHKAAVSAAVFSPNGNWVASGDVEGNVIIWSYPQLKVKNTFQIAKTINDLDWDADGTRIVAAGDGAQKYVCRTHTRSLSLQACIPFFPSLFRNSNVSR